MDGAPGWRLGLVAMSFYVFFLFLHVMTAILAFGTAILAFPVLGAFGEKEPAHRNFALRVNLFLGRRAVTPLAIATFGSGLVLLWLGQWDPVGDAWLGVSIILFLVTVVDAQLVTLPAVNRLVAISSASPEGGAAADSGAVPELTRRVRTGGSLSALLLVIITLLMVWKPGS